MPLPLVFDMDGNPRSWNWLTDLMGAVSLGFSEYQLAYRCVEVHVQRGHAALVVHLRQPDGLPIPGITCIRYWPDAPKLPEWDPPPERWFNRGVHGETNENGDWGSGMGGGDRYYPPEAGPSSIWIGELGVGSDCFHGLGWIVDPELNDLHLNLVFERSDEEPPPPPPPDDAWLILTNLLRSTGEMWISAADEIEGLL